ncbi:MAG: hypothetical protein JSU74_07580 [Candidatus Zixiibacteriota bacterium]|nr:MAG: hypothetical protein JSU74_07580 [candidate division Zixibacteria bacterium]
MGRFKNAARKARKLTNKQLADELAAITPFDRDRLRKFLPSPKDQKAFLELMEQVEAETVMDTKLAYLRQNLSTAGKVVFKVLRSFL